MATQEVEGSSWTSLIMTAVGPLDVTYINMGGCHHQEISAVFSCGVNSDRAPALAPPSCVCGLLSHMLQ